MLSGLSRPVPGLSVEFVAGHLDGAAACVRRLRELGAYRFNVVLGEGRDFVFDTWRGVDKMLDWLAGGAGGASSGDIYARLDRGVIEYEAVVPETEAVRSEAGRGGEADA